MASKELFITFEGPDGAGKTTQLRRLGERLQAQGYEVVMTREPGGTRISDQIRSLLLNPDHRELHARTEALLYAASRAQHIEELILPALERGAIVLCDRFVDASIAYQSVGLQLSRDSIQSINGFATGGLAPRRTYMIDLPPAVSRERLLASRTSVGLDRIEQRSEAYHTRVRESFLELAANNPHRILLLNGELSLKDLEERIWYDFQSLLD